MFVCKFPSVEEGLATSWNSDVVHSTWKKHQKQTLGRTKCVRIIFNTEIPERFLHQLRQLYRAFRRIRAANSSTVSAPILSYVTSNNSRSPSPSHSTKDSYITSSNHPLHLTALPDQPATTLYTTGHSAMTSRSTVLVMLAVVVVVVVETRPPRIKREQLFCSSREIRQMLVYVCNIARRSVHSQGPLETSTSLVPEWLSEKGYDKPNFHKLPLQTETEDASHRKRSSSQTPPRTRRNGGSLAFGSVQTNLIVRHSGGQTSVVSEDPARNNVDKRDGDSGEAQTIGDLRAKCCVEECTAQDFLGACSR